MKIMKESPLKIKSYAFSIRVVKLCQYLNRVKKEFLLSKQVLRSGTAIGALVREAEFGQSRADFVSKMSIALKEANETAYWLSLLKDSGYLQNEEFLSLSADCEEIIKILVVSVKTAKNNKL
jgi:four helix bundle protein